MSEEEKKATDLEDALEKERFEYHKKISELIPMISKLETVSETQVLMLSYRHMLTDKLAKYRSAIYKKKSNDVNYRKLRYEYYKTQHDVRLDYKEINEFINSDMSLRIRQTELIENQINYYKDCIDTLDKLSFAVKNKLIIEEINDRRNL